MRIKKLTLGESKKGKMLIVFDCSAKGADGGSDTVAVLFVCVSAFPKSVD